MPIRDLNRLNDWQLPDEEATTIAGLVIHEAQMIPQAGQAFTFHGFRFEVLRKRRNQLTQLRVTPVGGERTVDRRFRRLTGSSSRAGMTNPPPFATTPAELRIRLQGSDQWDRDGSSSLQRLALAAALAAAGRRAGGHMRQHRRRLRRLEEAVRQGGPGATASRPRASRR